MNINNCREFFLSFAKEKGFDPYRADNWNKINSKQLDMLPVPSPSN